MCMNRKLVCGYLCKNPASLVVLRCTGYVCMWDGSFGGRM